MGLLSGMVAGGAKGYADARLKVIDRDKTFDMKKQLMEAEFDMQKRLKEFDSDLTASSAKAGRDEIGGLIQSARDPNADKGGYETPEMKAEAEQAQLLREAKVLRDNGYLKESEDILKRQDAKSIKADKTELELAKLAHKMTYDAAILQNKSELIDIKLQALRAEQKTSAGKRPTAAEMESLSFYEAFGDNPDIINPETGKLTEKGFKQRWGRQPEVSVTTKKVPVKDEFGGDAKDEKGNLIMRDDVSTTTKGIIGSALNPEPEPSSRNPAHLFQKP